MIGSTPSGVLLAFLCGHRQPGCLSQLRNTVTDVVLHRVCPVCRRVKGSVCRSCVATAQTVGDVGGLPSLDAAVALYRYDKAVQRMIVAGKNRGRRDVLHQLGALMADQFSGRNTPQPVGTFGTFGDGPVVTWIPASRSGTRRRGYDQGEVLARSVAAELGLDCMRLLARGRGRSQTGRGRPQRLDGPVIRVVAKPLGALAVILVDDVISTGASMAAGTQVLRRSGVQLVTGLVAAWNASEPEVAAGRVMATVSRR